LKHSFEYYRDLVLVLTQKDLHARYKSNVLGYLWSIANPLAFAFVFYFAFSVVMRIKMDAYALFLITGMFPWQWIANSLNTNSVVFLLNANIIKKVNFPRNMLPFSLVLQDMLHFVFSIPVIILFLFMYHKTPSWTWLLGIPILLIVQFIFVYGLSLIVSSVNLFFRDMERFVTILVTLLFYFTPIIYPVSMLPEKYLPLINLNPFCPLIMSWRSLLFEGQISWMNILISLGYGLVALLVGTLVYRKLSWKFAEVL
jgi:homopolymeric O-antigen transport system permease protein